MPQDEAACGIPEKVKYWHGFQEVMRWILVQF
jgi:hypothetical protein